MSTNLPTASAAGGPQPLPVLAPECLPDYDSFVTEDDTPVDNIFTEKQQALLRDPLMSSWEGPGRDRPFLALLNVGLFYAVDRQPLVPDFMLSLDVRAAQDLHLKENRSYFVWVFGKPPDVVLEIVSDREGGEGDDKLRTYAQIGIPYYAIFDPLLKLGPDVLRVYGLNQGRYQPISPDWLPEVGLGLVLWEGPYEGARDKWLRWCDQHGHPLATGRERADAAERLLEQERRRAERLEQRLREMGVDP